MYITFDYRFNQQDLVNIKMVLYLRSTHNTYWRNHVVENEEETSLGWWIDVNIQHPTLYILEIGECIPYLAQTTSTH